MAELAEVLLSCGRLHLQVAGIVLAMEGDKCRDGEIPEELYDPIPERELAQTSIGGKSATDLPLWIVRHFRGVTWNEAMLRHAAATINAKAAELEE